MEWTVEANNEIGAFPYFARFRARKLIESNNKKINKNIVEMEDVLKIKEDEYIKKLLEIDYKLNNIEYKQNLKINICGGIRGCKRSHFDDMEVAKIFYKVLEETQILKVIETSKETRKNSSLKAAISGCPNSCSQPQIQDIGIVGYRKPKVIDGKCIQCGLCGQSCVLDLIEIDSEARIEIDSCIGCGKCIEVCPSGSIVELEKGYRILVGGRLGKLPQLAKTYVEVTSLEDLEFYLRRLIKNFEKCLKEGIRFSDLV